jgi:hypothetical protein
MPIDAHRPALLLVRVVRIVPQPCRGPKACRRAMHGLFSKMMTNYYLLDQAYIT